MNEEIDRCWRDEDRQFITDHFTAIAERMLAKRSWRTGWRVEVNGCVYKFKIDGYPKKGSAIYDERQAEIEQAMAEELSADERSTL